MLSREAQATVRATLPAVGAVINDITARFYERMFSAEPDLLNLFNQGNQSTQDQARALAGSVAAFATHLLDPGANPERLLERVAHKHVAVGVMPEQYTVVGRHLMAAIAEIVGEAATPDVLAAWDEVYWLMACLLVAAESRIRQETGTAADLWRAWRVVGRDENAPDVVSLVITPSDGGDIPAFKPGQYVSVAVGLPQGRRQIRQYSLSDGPDAGHWRITVKRVRGESSRPDGEISTFLHESVAVGDELTVSAPFGDVTPLDGGDSPLLLASAGIGCTPVVSMLRELSSRGSARPIRVIHADQSPSAHALRDDLADAVRALPNAVLDLWYEDLSGDAPAGAQRGYAQLGADPLPSDLRAYLCGPLPFMREMRSQLLRRGLPAEQIQYEVFGPDLWLPAEAPAA